jgi:GNAT superfamily N-acetyltransferase
MPFIHKAEPGHLAEVHDVLHSAAEDLHRRGIDQWPDGSPNFEPAALATQIRRGEFWMVRDRALLPVAVIAVSYRGDPDFWTPAELAAHAVYLSKAAILPRLRGLGLGASLFRWAVDLGWREGTDVVRLDAWSANKQLHGYYQARGWRFIRNDPPEGRRSGALFDRPAVPDPDARRMFRRVPPPAMAL